MMHPMYEMKFLPLPGGQRTQNRMIEQSDAMSEARFALRDHGIHFHDLLHPFTSHLFRWQSPGLSYPRCFASGRQVTKADNDQSAQALPGGRRHCHSLARFEQSLESLNRSRIGQVQVLQNLGRTPFPWQMPTHLLIGHAYNRRLQSAHQFFKAGIHRTTLAFPRASGRMCATSKHPNS